MTKHYQNFRLDEQIDADLLAMAERVGKPGNRTAGLYALAADWRRLKAAHEIRESYRAAQIARHEECCDAMEHRAAAEGR